MNQNKTNNYTTRNSFSKLKRSMMLKSLFIVMGSLVVGLIIFVVFIEGIFQGTFGHFMVDMFQRFGMGVDEANYTYYYVFMNNKTLWVFVGFLVILAIAFYITLSRLTKYFDEVANGVNKLVSDKDEPIHLSPELDFMEEKLNEVKDNLTQKEMEAKEAEQRKNDLVVYLAHDIKTPLTSIVGYLNLLEESPDLPIESRAKYTRITLEKAYRLEELINEFFDITRFNLQSIVLDKTNVNLEIMLSQIADEFFPSLEEKSLSTNLDFQGDLVIDADSQQLARVFNNVIKNAISYSNEGSEIQISAVNNTGISDNNSDINNVDKDTNGSISNNNVVIQITNTGANIPSEKLTAIFDKFYRLDQSRATDKGGSGLGLAIAKKIVNAHDGDISANSNDGITTFTIILPVIR